MRLDDIAVGGYYAVSETGAADRIDWSRGKVIATRTHRRYYPDGAWGASSDELGVKLSFSAEKGRIETVHPIQVKAPWDEHLDWLIPAAAEMMVKSLGNRIGKASVKRLKKLGLRSAKFDSGYRGWDRPAVAASLRLDLEDLEYLVQLLEDYQKRSDV